MNIGRAALPSPRKNYVGRGAQIRPDNRFNAVRRESVHGESASAPDESNDVTRQRIATRYYVDDSKSIVSENESPDIGFRYSLNPYRGCAHGCSYCYARPTHEYLGMDAGLDFESKILVKHRAPELFRDWLSRDRYVCEMIMFSGVTDCYQPAERTYQLTRACLQVAADAGQPLSIVTKNGLVTRDLDVMRPMADRKQIAVAVSLTTLDPRLASEMEPRTSSPLARLRAICQLADAGIPVHVLLAPVIPGLNDHEIPAILKAARAQGARSCSHTMLRLPLSVRPVFLDWLERCVPERADRVKRQIRSIRRGEWNDARFGHRMRGVGELPDQIHQIVKVFAKRLGYAQRAPELNTEDFHPPTPANGQRWLF